MGRGYAVGWDLVIESVPLSRLAADGQILNGPLFTSDAHPWPRYGSMIALPIVQLDLAALSALSGDDLGSGMVQLWQEGVDMITRVVPTTDLSASPADIPAFVPDETLEAFQFDLGSFGLPAFVTNPHRVTGFAGPYIFGPMGSDEFLGELAASITQIAASRSAFAALMQAVTLGREQYAQLNRVFGSFDGISSYPNDLPRTIFSSDDERILNTGDAGVISLHLDLQNGVPRFSGCFQCC